MSAQCCFVEYAKTSKSHDTEVKWNPQYLRAASDLQRAHAINCGFSKYASDLIDMCYEGPRSDAADACKSGAFLLKIPPRVTAFKNVEHNKSNRKRDLWIYEALVIIWHYNKALSVKQACEAASKAFAYMGSRKIPCFAFVKKCTEEDCKCIPTGVVYTTKKKRSKPKAKTGKVVAKSAVQAKSLAIAQISAKLSAVEASVKGHDHERLANLAAIKDVEAKMAQALAKQKEEYEALLRKKDRVDNQMDVEVAQSVIIFQNRIAALEAELQRSSSAAGSSIAQLQGRKEEYEKQILQLQQQLNAAQAEAASTQQRLADTIRDIEQERAERVAEVEELQKQHQQRVDKIIADKLAESADVNRRFEQEIQQRDETIRNLTDDMNRLKSEHQQQIAAYEAEVKKLRDMIENAQKQIRSLGGEVNKKDEDALRMQLQQTAYARDIQKLNDQIRKLEHELTAAQQTVSVQVQNIREMTQRQDQLQDLELAGKAEIAKLSELVISSQAAAQTFTEKSAFYDAMYRAIGELLLRQHDYAFQLMMFLVDKYGTAGKTAFMSEMREYAKEGQQNYSGDRARALWASNNTPEYILKELGSMMDNFTDWAAKVRTAIKKETFAIQREKFDRQNELENLASQNQFLSAKVQELNSMQEQRDELQRKTKEKQEEIFELRVTVNQYEMRRAAMIGLLKGQVVPEEYLVIARHDPEFLRVINETQQQIGFAERRIEELQANESELLNRLEVEVASKRVLESKVVELQGANEALHREIVEVRALMGHAAASGRALESALPSGIFGIIGATASEILNALKGAVSWQTITGTDEQQLLNMYTQRLSDIQRSRASSEELFAQYREMFVKFREEFNTRAALNALNQEEVEVLERTHKKSRKTMEPVITDIDFGGSSKAVPKESASKRMLLTMPKKLPLVTPMSTSGPRAIEAKSSPSGMELVPYEQPQPATRELKKALLITQVPSATGPAEARQILKAINAPYSTSGPIKQASQRPIQTSFETFPSTKVPEVATPQLKKHIAPLVQSVSNDPAFDPMDEDFS